MVGDPLEVKEIIFYLKLTDELSNNTIANLQRSRLRYIKCQILSRVISIFFLILFHGMFQRFQTEN